VGLVKKAIALMLACSLALGVAACNETASKEQTTLTWWDTYGRDGTEKSVINAIAKYEEAHPDVKIERVSVPFSEMQRKLLLAMVGGELPDIMIVDNPNHNDLFCTFSEGIKEVIVPKVAHLKSLKEWIT
jgi:multiple sugar transport system substrate-binding protein